MKNKPAKPKTPPKRTRFGSLGSLDIVAVECDEKQQVISDPISGEEVAWVTYPAEITIKTRIPIDFATAAAVIINGVEFRKPNQ